MKANMRKKGIFALWAVSVLFAVALLVFCGFGTADAVLLTFEGEELQKEYAVGTTVTLPKAKIKVGDKEWEAIPETICPDGSVTTLRTVEANRVGTYTVRYRCVLDGKIYAENVCFSTYRALYSVSSSRSSVRYGTSELAPELKGLVLSLQAGDTFSFHKPINLFGKTPFDNGMPVFVTPSVLGETDFEQLCIRLTDAYDDANYVTITVRDGKAAGGGAQVSYSKGGAQDRVLSGLEDGRGIKFGGTAGHVESLSFCGLPKEGTFADKPFELKYDYENKQIHSRKRYAGTLVTDLDSLEYFDNPWTRGFTTGEVYVSVWGEYYTKAVANMVITGIFDEDITAARAEDMRAPLITVDTGNYATDALPAAVKGKPYDIFPAKAVDDVSGEVRVTARVYYNYYSDNRIEIDSFGGSFTPAKVGTAYIEYSAVDGMGNRGVVVLEVPVQAKSAPIGIIVDTQNRVTVDVVGKLVPVAPVSYSRGTLDVSVSSESGNVTVENGYFRPMETGVYTIKYTVTDYIGYAETQQYTVNITAGNAPVFGEMPVLPKYFLGGYQCELPVIKAYNYTDGSGSEVPVKIETSADGGAFAPVQNNIFRPSGSTVRVRYTAELANKDSAVYMSEPIPVVMVKDTNGFRLAAYFVPENAQVVLTDEAAALTVNGDGGVDFASALIADGFSLRFAADSANFAANRITVTLTDSVNPEISLAVNLLRSSSGTIINVNGGNNYVIPSASFTDGKEYNISYDNITLRLTADSEKGVYVDAGKANFGGFPSGRVYMRITAHDSDNRDTCLLVKAVCGQMFRSGVTNDTIKPKISYPTPEKAIIRQIYTIKGGIAVDVLSSYVKFTVTVFAPSGDPVAAVDGTVLEDVSGWETYQIALNEYGTYRVEYYAEDENKRRESNIGYSINVVNTTPPAIVVDESKIKSAVKIGERVEVPKAQATDDVDGETEVRVYIIAPSGKLTRFVDKGFTPQEKGVYKILYEATDSSDNTLQLCFEVTAE